MERGALISDPYEPHGGFQLRHVEAIRACLHHNRLLEVIDLRKSSMSEDVQTYWDAHIAPLLEQNHRNEHRLAPDEDC